MTWYLQSNSNLQLGVWIFWRIFWYVLTNSGKVLHTKTKPNYRYTTYFHVRNNYQHPPKGLKRQWEKKKRNTLPNQLPKIHKTKPHHQNRIPKFPKVNRLLRHHQRLKVDYPHWSLVAEIIWPDEDLALFHVQINHQQLKRVRRVKWRTQSKLGLKMWQKQGGRVFILIYKLIFLCMCVNIFLW